MRNTITFFSLLFFTINFYSQKNYKIIYKIDPINLLENNESYSRNKSVKITKIIKGVIKETKKRRFILIANSEASYFLEKKKINTDFENKSNELFSRLSKLITAFNEKVYTNYNNQNLFFTRSLLGTNYNVYKETFYNFNWNITEEEKIINGLKALKAIGSYHDIIRGKDFEIIAWFIPSIPIPAGPDIYLGLPGLVGELHLSRAIVTIDSVELTSEKLEKPEFDNALTYKEYEDFVSKGNEKIDEYIEN